MQMQQPFNPQAFNPNQGGAGQLPVGPKQVMKVISTNIKATKNNDGGYLDCTIAIIDGPGAGATGSMKYNLWHSNPETVRIANEQLSALCHVLGLGQTVITDTEMLHEIPFRGDVTPQANEPKYTQLSKVYDINGNEPTAGGQPAQQGQAQQQQGGFGGQQQQPQQQGFGGGGQQAQGQQQGGFGGQQQQGGFQPPAQQQQQQGGFGGQGGAPWGQRS